MPERTEHLLKDHFFLIPINTKTIDKYAGEKKFILKFCF